MSLAGVTGIVGTFGFTWFRRRIGLERTGLLAFNFELICLILCVVSVWAPGSLFEANCLFDPPDLELRRNCSLVASVVVATMGNESDVGYGDVGSQFEALDCPQREIPKEKISILLFLIGVITSRVGEYLGCMILKLTK